MNLLGTINEHISAKPLPLVAITVAAVPCPDTPVILTLHWTWPLRAADWLNVRGFLKPAAATAEKAAK